MARVPSLFLKREDYREVQDEWMDRLLRPLNTFGKQVQDALNRGLTLGENSRAFVKTLTFTSGGSAAYVAASYYLTLAQTPGAGAIVNYDTGDYDTDGAVTTGAGWKFTVPAGKGGLYHVSAGLDFSPSANGGFFHMFLYRNGSNYRRLAYIAQNNASNQYAGMWSSIDLVLAAGDYIQIYATGATGVGINNDAGNKENYFTLHRVPSSGVAATGPAPFPLKMRNELAGNARPVGVQILSAQDVTSGSPVPVSLGQPAWSTSSDQVLITDIAGMAPGRKYQVTVAVLGG